MPMQSRAGLIFIPSKNGLSDCPVEWSDIDHLAQGVDVLFETPIKLTGAQ